MSADVATLFEAAKTALEEHRLAAHEFEVALSQGDWPRAERARVSAIAHIEAYFDRHFEAWRRVMTRERRD